MAAGLADFPEPTFWSKWFGGIIVPALFMYSGIFDCIRKQAVLHGRDATSLELADTDAVALGITWISAACFLHFHYFWTACPRLIVLSEFGKIVSALCFIGSLGYVFWSILSGWF